MLKNFTIPAMAPTLVGGLGQGGSMDIFATKFGNTWKKTSVKGVFFIAIDGCQFTLRGDDCAWYDFETVAEFKRVFDNEKDVLAGNAQYFTLLKTSKYSAIDIMKFLKDQEIHIF